MGLVRLLTDLTAGLSSTEQIADETGIPTGMAPQVYQYPSHHSYNNDGISIFDTKSFNQKNIINDDGSGHPFIQYGFDGENNTIKLDDYATVQLAQALDSGGIGDFIRGGTVLNAERRHIDYERIDKFLHTPSGESFLNKQVALQLSNPRLDAPMKGALDIDIGLNMGLFGKSPDPNQLEYDRSFMFNKTKRQVGLTGLTNIAREGLIPFSHYGYADAISFDKKDSFFAIFKSFL